MGLDEFISRLKRHELLSESEVLLQHPLPLSHAE